MPMNYTSRVRVHERYKIVGFISSGTYGRVYKAIYWNGSPGEFAIKKYVSFFPKVLEVLTRYIGSNRTRRAK